MSFLVALNTICIGFRVALITHIMNFFVALMRTSWFVNISQTKLLKTLSVQEDTHQIQTYCERKKSWDSTFKASATEMFTRSFCLAIHRGKGDITKVLEC